MSTMTVAPTTTTPPASIGGSAIGDGLNSSQSAASIMQMYTTTVLQTPIMALPSNVDQLSKSNVSTQLPADQKTAQAHATYYLNTLNPQMVAFLATTIGYANQWNAQYKLLLQLANTITEGNNLQSFVQGVELLISKCQKGESQANGTANALTNFATNDLDADVQAFTVDWGNVNTAYNDDSQEIQQLQKLIDADNKAMNTAVWATAASGVLVVAGGVAILVGVFGEIESAGTSTALIVGGFALMGGAAVVGAVEFTSWVTANKNLIAATNQLNQDQAVLAATQQALINISSLKDACSQASTAALGLAGSWNSLAGDLQQTIDALQDAEDLGDAPTWLPSLLETANSDWQTVLTLATDLQANGTLPVQTQTQTQS